MGGANRPDYRYLIGSCMASFWGTGNPSQWWIARTRATLVHRATGTCTYQTSSYHEEAPEITGENCPQGRVCAPHTSYIQATMYKYFYKYFCFFLLFYFFLSFFVYLSIPSFFTPMFIYLFLFVCLFSIVV